MRGVGHSHCPCLTRRFKQAALVGKSKLLSTVRQIKANFSAQPTTSPQSPHNQTNLPSGPPPNLFASSPHPHPPSALNPSGLDQQAFLAPLPTHHPSLSNDDEDSTEKLRQLLLREQQLEEEERSVSLSPVPQREEEVDSTEELRRFLLTEQMEEEFETSNSSRAGWELHARSTTSRSNVTTTGSISESQVTPSQEGEAASHSFVVDRDVDSTEELRRMLLEEQLAEEMHQSPFHESALSEDDSTEMLRLMLLKEQQEVGD